MNTKILKNCLEKIVLDLERELILDAKLIATRPPGPNTSSIEPIIFSDELKYLNSFWGNWTEPSSFVSHRPIFGKLISWVKRKIQGYFFNVIFKDYFERERQFNIKLVQFCNLTARYIDSRNEKLFWELVQKIDTEINQTNDRNDTIVSEFIRRYEVNGKF